MTLHARSATIKLVITRKPPPPALDPFICAVCEDEVERDPYNPDRQRPPVCFVCMMDTPTRPQLAWTGVDHWSDFRRAHALLCAIDKEIARARSTH